MARRCRPSVARAGLTVVDLAAGKSSKHRPKRSNTQRKETPKKLMPKIPSEELQTSDKPAEVHLLYRQQPQSMPSIDPPPRHPHKLHHEAGGVLAAAEPERGNKISTAQSPAPPQRPRLEHQDSTDHQIRETHHRKPIGAALEDLAEVGRELQYCYSTPTPPPPPRQRHR